MNISRLSRVHMNLLATLHVLLQERHAGRSAKRLNISQSSVSKNLAQLRELFKDQLFFKAPNGLTPTPLALDLAPRVAEVIRSVDGLLEPQAFSPLDFEGRISLAMQDTGFVFIAPDLVSLCEKQAPGIAFDLWLKDDKGLQELLFGEIDLLIVPQDLGQRWQTGAQLIHKELYREPLACLFRKGHPALDVRWDEEAYLRFTHIGVRDEQFGASMLDRTLTAENRSRDMSLMVPDFRSATRLCEASDLIFTCSHSWAELAVKERGLVRRPLPFGDFYCAYQLAWHQRTDNSPVHKWLRERIVEVAEGLRQQYQLD